MTNNLSPKISAKYFIAVCFPCPIKPSKTIGALMKFPNVLYLAFRQI